MTGLETVAALTELANGLNEIARKSESNRDVAARVIKVLRTVYFTPSGTMALIEQLARGERPSSRDVEEVLPTFNDKEWRIVRGLEELDFDKLQRSGALSIRQCRVLQEICWGKRNLRASVQDFLNEALTTGETPSAAQAKKLLEQINALNTAIEDAEEALR